jgi:hypothetical protein
MTMQIDEYFGDMRWYNDDGKLHRNGGLPAIEAVDEYTVWYVNGDKHRLGGLPAVVYADGRKLWYIYNIEYTSEKICNYYKILKNFGRLCLKKIKMRKLRRLRWIHGELLCMPPKGNYPGGQDYQKMVSYFMSM